MSGALLLADALLARAAAARDARWFSIGVVASYAAGEITATIDGATVAGIRALSPWIPVADEVALFAVVRGSASVQYLGVGALWAGSGPMGTYPSMSTYPSTGLYPGA